MPAGKCIFCDQPLDGSEQHVIPKCLNGRLTSKIIVCRVCNKLFGRSLDKELRTQLNPLLLFMGFKNASQVHATGTDNKTYLINRELGVEPIRPELYLRKKGRKSGIVITGRPKERAGIIKKLNELLAGMTKDAIFVESAAEPHPGVVPAVHLSMNLKITGKINILFNKIALEYLAIHDRSMVEGNSLLARVHALDQTLDNVTFCNADNEIRNFHETEISHVMIIIGDSKAKKLRAYIELFNLYCGIVNLSDDYKGDGFKISFAQDAITGKRLEAEIINKVPITDEIAYMAETGLNKLCAYLMDRQRNRYVNEVIELNLNERLASLREAYEAGKISESELVQQAGKEGGEIYASLAYAIPYSVEIVDGQPPYDNDDYNFFHSNFKRNEVEEFLIRFQKILNRRIIINNEMFSVDSFQQEPCRVDRNFVLTKIYGVLRSVESGQQHFVPVRQLIQMLNSAKPVGPEELTDYNDAAM